MSGTRPEGPAAGRRPRLLIMVKQPRPGRVKTRLGRDIGRIDATWWFRHAVSRTLRALARDPRWEVLLLVAPDEAVHARDWAAPGAGRLRRLKQGGGDLGARGEIGDPAGGLVAGELGRGIGARRPLDLHAARFRAPDPRQEVEKGALAGSVLAQQRPELAGLAAQSDLVQDAAPALREGDLLQTRSADWAHSRGLTSGRPARR